MASCSWYLTKHCIPGTFVAPMSGHYFLQFHGLAERGSQTQLMLEAAGSEVAHVYDRDISGRNERYAMLGQSVVVRLMEGEEALVRLHGGALKGGGEATYTSFVGFRLAPVQPEDNEI